MRSPSGDPETLVPPEQPPAAADAPRGLPRIFAVPPRPRRERGSGEGSGGSDEKRSLLLPSPADLVFVLWALVAAVGFGGLMFNADGDTGRHIRLGSTILERGILRHDIFSHATLGQPLINHEWLSQVLIALAHRLGGLVGVVVLTSVVLALSVALVTRFLQKREVPPLYAFGAGMLVALVSVLHWAARPHVFSFLCAVLLLELLESPRRRLVGLVALFALWANLHGGFIFGLVVVFLYAVGGVVGKDPLLIRRRLAELGAATAAVLANPYGFVLPLHVAGWFGNRLAVDHTVEYLSPDFHTNGPLPFLWVLIVLLVGLGRSTRKVEWPHLLVIGSTVAFALISRRNIALFAFTALPLAALYLKSLPAGRPGQVFETGARRSRFGGWAAVGAVLLFVVAANDGRVGNRQLLQASYLPWKFPVEAVAQARAAGLEGNLFNEMTWGGYVLYAWPEQRVFIDGQTDHYGEELFREYGIMGSAQEGWRALLEHYDISLVLIPPDWPLARALEDESGWERVIASPTAIVYTRRQLADDESDPAQPTRVQGIASNPGEV